MKNETKTIEVLIEEHIAQSLENSDNMLEFHGKVQMYLTADEIRDYWYKNIGNKKIFG